MHFLSIESSSQFFALAVSNNDKVIKHKAFGHASLLENVILTNIDALLKSAKLPLTKIDAFVISIGPGSFTSLRVGLATLKGFCMGLNKPIVGIPTLDVIAHGVLSFDSDEICVIADARRGLVYSGIYKRKGSSLMLSGEYVLSPIAQVLKRVRGKTLFVGDGVALYRDVIVKAYAGNSGKRIAQFADQQYSLPDVKVLASLGFARLINKSFDDPALLVPLYLYEDDCQVDGGQKRKVK